MYRTSGFNRLNLGNTRGEPHPNFSFVSQFVITLPEFISEPVADKVNTVPKGTASCTCALRVTISHASPSYLLAAAINFVPSMTDPPPTATIKSILFSLTISTPLRTVSTRGFGSIPDSSNTSKSDSFSITLS